MFRNYLITAVRNFAHHKLDSFINIAGLSVGLASTILIVLFLRDELSYDRWIPDSENLYRVEMTFHLPGRAPWRLAQVPFPVLQAMQEQIPEVKAVIHVVPEQLTVTVGNRHFSESAAVVDPSFFQVIKLPLVEGDSTKALAQPESIVLTQSTARKYFGNVDPLGKIMTVVGSGLFCPWEDSACRDATHLLTVTGVLKDLPHNTQLKADLILPNTSQADEIPQWLKQRRWTATLGGYGYVVLAPGVDPQAVVDKLKPILDRSITSEDKKLNGANVRGSELEEFHLTRFWDVHLKSDKYGGMTPAGDMARVYGFSVISILILVVACFNFMNLATARATLRAREISLRKAVGARRGQLIAQFLGEALFTVLISLTGAFALVEILLPAYDQLLGRPIVFHYLNDWSLLLAIVAAAAAAAILSGAYPALVLSSFGPSGSLRTGTVGRDRSSRTRLILVVLQFAVSICLGTATMVVFSQINHARKIDLEFDRNGIVVIRGISKLTVSARESFSHALLLNPQITGVSLSNAVPFYLSEAPNIPVKIEGQPQSFNAHLIIAGAQLPSLYEIPLLAGRLLSHKHGEDVFGSYPLLGVEGDMGRNVLINATAARRFGFTPDQAIGKTIVAGSGHLRIAGVLGDAKIDGLKEPVSPAVYCDFPLANTILSVRMRGGQVSDTLSYIDQSWHTFAPGSAVQRYFLGDTFDDLFHSDAELGEMFGLFVGIAIFIACLGLFGLAAFTAQRRTKEIGVRKVFGASTIDIVRLLLWQFSIPVMIANLIAWPITYYYLRHWLESYAYRIDLSPLYFLSAGFIALLIAWTTVFVHAQRVARASPIQALRYE